MKRVKTKTTSSQWTHSHDTFDNSITVFFTDIPSEFCPVSRTYREQNQVCFSISEFHKKENN